MQMHAIRRLLMLLSLISIGARNYPPVSKPNSSRCERCAPSPCTTAACIIISLTCGISCYDNMRYRETALTTSQILNLTPSSSINKPDV